MKAPTAARASSKTTPTAQPAKVAPPARRGVGPAINAIWSKLATRPSAGIAVAAPDTERERAADRVAEQATGESRGHGSPSRARAPAPLVDSDTRARLEQPGNGDQIASDIRGPVERKTRQDLSHARVHSTERDRATADALGARAFAFNNHIYVGSRSSVSDRGLMAHELAHVAAPMANVVQRDPIPDAGAPAGTPAPAPPVTPPTSPPPVTPPPPATVPPTSADDFKNAQDSSIVELKGHRTFLPSTSLANEIESMGGDELFVRVRFGSMAEGVIPIRWTDQGYRTPSPKPFFPAWGIPLTHAAFPGTPGAEPTLWILVERGVVTGAMGWKTPVALAMDPDKFRQLIPASSLIAGLADFQNVELHGIVDTLKNGHFTYSVADVEFDSDDFHGSGRIRVDDEQFDFQGGLDVPVSGLPTHARVPLKRESAGGLLSTVSGNATWRFERKVGATGRLTASVVATLAKGVMDVRGFGRYDWSDPKNPDRRISGQLTIIITNFDDAKQKVIDQLGDDAPANIVPAAPNEDLAVTGWGELDFALSDWITGNAEVIVHPEGYVTARGEFLPTKVIKLTDKHTKEWDLFAPPPFVEVIGGIPLVGDLRVEAQVKIKADGSFGPGTLHDLRITGLISSDPAITNRFEVGGFISAPAEAALHLTGKVALSAYLAHLKEMASLSINAKGILRLKMYAEAEAAVGRRKSAAAPGDAEYYLKAHALATAGLELALTLKATGSLVLLGDLDIDLLDRKWPIGGTGARLDLTYVFGRGKEKDSELLTSFTGVDFDEGAFAKAVARGKKIEAKGFKGEKAADTKAESDVVNPDAPVPFAPAVPATAPPTGTTPLATTTPADPNAPPPPTTALVKVLDEPFDMNGEPHTLHLALVDPPSIDMESPPPRENLLKKISRARERAKKDRNTPNASRTSLDTQILALEAMERQAKQVLDSAKLINKESPYLSPRVPGYAQLATLIHDYGDKFSVTDLSKALDVATVDPKSPETILVRYPNLAKSELNRQIVARILEQGVAATTVRPIVDFMYTYGYSDDIAEELLNNIYFMAAARIVGYQTALNEMASQRTKAKGGEFILRYLGRKKLWGSNVQLEVAEDDANGDRRWDAWIEGTLYEFKAWKAWSGKLEEAFLRQMVLDYGKVKVGKDMPLRWVFNGEIPVAELHESMERALLKEIDKLKKGKSTLANATVPMLTTIHGQIRSIVRVF